MAYYQGGCLTIIIPTHSNLQLNRKPIWNQQFYSWKTKWPKGSKTKETQNLREKVCEIKY
jgi:hypothetical protein